MATILEREGLEKDIGYKGSLNRVIALDVPMSFLNR
jgi:hypothetical protein